MNALTSYASDEDHRLPHSNAEYDRASPRSNGSRNSVSSSPAATSSKIKLTKERLKASSPHLPFSETDLREVQDEETRRLLPLLLPVPHKPDDGIEDSLWGLSTDDPEEGWDVALEAKLARFHDLKSQGVHFNESLMSNHSFNNPHIYSHLVEFVDVDETRSNFPDIMGDSAWNPHAFETLKDGDPDRITKLQEAEEDEREYRQKRAKKRSIGFVSSSTDTSSSSSTGKKEALHYPKTDLTKDNGTVRPHKSRDRRHDNGTHAN